MVLCVESYVGPGGAREGVKWERQALITETGYRLLDRFPWERENESLVALLPATCSAKKHFECRKSVPKVTIRIIIRLAG